MVSFPSLRQTAQTDSLKGHEAYLKSWPLVYGSLAYGKAGYQNGSKLAVEKACSPHGDSPEA